MYTNIDNLLKLEFVHNIVYLLVLKHASKKDVSQYLLKSGCTLGNLNDLKEQGYVKFIKGKKDQTQFQKARLDKKGTEFLDNLTEVEVGEDDIKLEEWLHETYSKRPNYQKSNRKQTKRLLAWFKNETGIEKNELSNLFRCFLNDTFVTETSNKDLFWKEFNEEKQDNKRLQLSNKLENVLWKSDNIYSRKFKLEESVLYSYYIENKDYVDLQYKIFLEKWSK